MDNRDGKIYWIGVSFDPFDDISEGYLAEQQEAITTVLDSEQVTLTVSSLVGDIFVRSYQPPWSEPADLIEVWYEDNVRIGFGMEVNARNRTDISRLKDMMRFWLVSSGITLFIDFYEIDTSAPFAKPRPAGVDEMLSLDII